MSEQSTTEEDAIKARVNAKLAATRELAMRVAASAEATSATLRRADFELAAVDMNAAAAERVLRRGGGDRRVNAREPDRRPIVDPGSLAGTTDAQALTAMAGALRQHFASQRAQVAAMTDDACALQQRLARVATGRNST